MTTTQLAAKALHEGEGKRLSILGSTIVIKADKEATGGGYSLVDYTAPANWPGPPRHIHKETDETFYILESTFRFQISEAEPFDIGPGGFVFVPRGTPHKLSNPADQPGRHLVLITPGGFEGYFEELATWLERNPVWPPRDGEAFARLMARYDTYPA